MIRLRTGKRIEAGKESTANSEGKISKDRHGKEETQEVRGSRPGKTGKASGVTDT